MLFRPIGEVPTPRYSLDEYDHEDANVTITHEFDWDEEEFGRIGSQIKTLLILAPRIVNLGYELGGNSLLNFTVKSIKKFHHEAFVDLDGNDIDDEEVGPVSTEVFHRIQIFNTKASSIEGLAVLPLPLIPDSDANYFAKQLFKALEHSLESVIVVTPGTLFDSPIAALYTSHTKPNNALDIPLATPPAIVQGTPAALLSHAQRLGLSATGLIVHSEGPCGHEAIKPSDFELLKSSIFKLAKVRASPENPDMSTLYV